MKSKLKNKKAKKNKKADPAVEEAVEAVDAVEPTVDEAVTKTKKVEEKKASKKSKRSASEAEVEVPLSEKASKGKKKKAEELGKKKPLKTDKMKVQPVEEAAASAEAVAERARTDAGVRRGLAQVGHELGVGLSVLVNVLDPEVVVLGGYFAVLGDDVLEPARVALDALLASPVQVRPELRPGRLGIAAAALGAAERSLEPVFGGEVALLA